ncbi:hypothetical protein [Streptomyces sp. NPDC096012]|uniref:hypothetical protein n=1 Tax=Streptomyces sp. NPDC096012 TaxID=3155684 RepID=UPI003369CCBE
MAVDRLPGGVREFASYLDGLLARLDQDGGWCGVFWRRDPEGMRACLDGRELPPWDVVEALLQDLGASYGPAAEAAERQRARALRAAALTAHDARPGARNDLIDRLDVMLREQRYAAERQAGLRRLLSAPASPEDAESLRLDLAWAEDDHERATARCAELRGRLEQLESQAMAYGAGATPPVGPAAGHPGAYAPPDPAHPTAYTPADPAHPAPYTPPDPAHPTAYTPPGPAHPGPHPPPDPAHSAPQPPPAPAGPRKRRRGSARFAGLAEDEPAVAVPPAAVDVPADDQGGLRTPRGARFAGAATPDRPVPAPVASPDAGAAEAVGTLVERLARLRAEGRSGEAHVLLVEATGWPASRFPLLAEALHRAGLGADWATLLWEAVALPADRLVTAADALAAAGRDHDGRQLLRQGVARPAEQIGAAVLRLDDEARGREARALLDAYVRVRTPEEAALSAATAPDRLVPLLLEAAHAVSDERHWDLVHALRVAGHTW